MTLSKKGVQVDSVNAGTEGAMGTAHVAILRLIHPKGLQSDHKIRTFYFLQYHLVLFYLRIFHSCFYFLPYFIISRLVMFSGWWLVDRSYQKLRRVKVDDSYGIETKQ